MRSVQYDKYGTGLVFAEWSAGEGSGSGGDEPFVTRDRQVDLGKKADASVREDKAVLDYFRKPSKLIRTDGIVAETSRQITGVQDRCDKARGFTSGS